VAASSASTSRATRLRSRRTVDRGRAGYRHQMFVFFSNRLAYAGSILISLVGTLILLLLLGVFD
jgi:hypothetical protein